MRGFLFLFCFPAMLLFSQERLVIEISDERIYALPSPSSSDPLPEYLFKLEPGKPSAPSDLRGRAFAGVLEISIPNPSPRDLASLDQGGLEVFVSPHGFAAQADWINEYFLLETLVGFPVFTDLKFYNHFSRLNVMLDFEDQKYWAEGHLFFKEQSWQLQYLNQNDHFLFKNQFTIPLVSMRMETSISSQEIYQGGFAFYDPSHRIPLLLGVQGDFTNLVFWPWLSLPITWENQALSLKINSDSEDLSLASKATLEYQLFNLGWDLVIGTGYFQSLSSYDVINPGVMLFGELIWGRGGSFPLGHIRTDWELTQLGWLASASMRHPVFLQNDLWFILTTDFTFEGSNFDTSVFFELQNSDGNYKIGIEYTEQSFSGNLGYAHKW